MPWQHIGYTTWVDVIAPILKERGRPSFYLEAWQAAEAIANFGHSLWLAGGLAQAKQQGQQDAAQTPGAKNSEQIPEEVQQSIEEALKHPDMQKLIEKLKERDRTKHKIDPLTWITPIGAYQHPKKGGEEDK